jgi:hypothetical protein
MTFLSGNNHAVSCKEAGGGGAAVTCDMRVFLPVRPQTLHGCRSGGVLERREGREGGREVRGSMKMVRRNEQCCDG